MTTTSEQKDACILAEPTGKNSPLFNLVEQQQDLGNNNIVDEGCRYLSLGNWQQLTSLSLCKIGDI